MKTILFLPLVAVIIAATLAAPGRDPNHKNVRDCLGADSNGGCLLNMSGFVNHCTKVSVTVSEWTVEHLLNMNNEELNCLKSLSREEVTAWYMSLDNGAQKMINAFLYLFAHENRNIDGGEDVGKPVPSSRGIEEFLFGDEGMEGYCSENEDRQGAQIVTGAACAFRAAFRAACCRWEWDWCCPEEEPFQTTAEQDYMVDCGEWCG